MHRFGASPVSVQLRDLPAASWPMPYVEGRPGKRHEEGQRTERVVITVAIAFCPLCPWRDVLWLSVL